MNMIFKMHNEHLNNPIKKQARDLERCLTKKDIDGKISIWNDGGYHTSLGSWKLKE